MSHLRQTTDHSRSGELPQLKQQKSQISQARTFLNKQSNHTVTKEYLNQRINEVVTEYSTATNLRRKDSKIKSRDSLDQTSLIATAKNIEFRRAVYRDVPPMQRTSTSKQRDSAPPGNIEAMVRLSLPKPTRHHLPKATSSSSKIKSETQINPMKPCYDTYLNQFLFTLNLSNALTVTNTQQATYRAFIDKGNNGLLLKSIVKRRWWWHLVDEAESCNLLWTEWTNKEFVEKMNVMQRDNGKVMRTEESAKQLGSLKSTVKVVENIYQKQARIGKIINLGMFTKLNLKLASDPESYYIFSKKLANGSPPELLNSLFCSELKDPRALDSKDQQIAKIHNHLEGGLNLHSKKLLLSNLKKFYQSQGREPFESIPLTFHVKEGTNDEEFVKLLAYFDQIQSKSQAQRDKEDLPPGKKSKKKSSQRNIWICKPGENSNRGNGISVVNKRQQLIELAKPLQTSTFKRSIIIQKYIENPFLVQKRKFDIRCYILITTYNGYVKGYWFEEGYIRTASEQFSLDDVDNKLIHLTNDAIQKKGKEYGKFQNANKMSFEDFQQYIEEKSKYPRSRFQKAYEDIKLIARDLVESVQSKLNPKKKEFAFELFGLDFMFDSLFKPWLIEANSNPCLDTTGPLLGRLIPEVIENVFKLAIDPIFPPPNMPPKTKVKTKEDYFEKNRFVLIYDSQEPGITKPKPQESETEVELEKTCN